VAGLYTYPSMHWQVGAMCLLLHDQEPLQGLWGSLPSAGWQQSQVDLEWPVCTSSRQQSLL
jgi:hypothetical protein